MKKLFLFSTLLLAINIAFAQDDELPPPTSTPKPEAGRTTDGDDLASSQNKKKVDWSKFILEPNFNLALSQGRLDVGASPYVGYNVWKNLYAGGGITYFYTGFNNLEVVDIFNNRLGSVKANFHTYGGGVFLQYNIWNGIFTRAKLEVLHRNMSDMYALPVPKNPNRLSDGFTLPRIQRTIPSLLVGVGYNLLQSKNFFLPILVSYNLLNSVTDKTYSIYPNAFVVQLGFINVF